ncbi:alpha/beta hydrolase [Ureibacillus aquaedulcis]|uniref:Alpha/beta hydrolase n=1 Tax=Ureibacillus aquaedulcis TaxID=3058421 RepID=A0ABT8GQR3_9BACL|nr:alpha/beta hydrolase [Ureibacillus sp. BA0131]MDN4493743.1 alpha/beta hydrolase [Ureibacillus sp. BA0131]
MWKWEAEGQTKAVVVLLHSAFEHHQWYAWLIEKLRTEGFTIVMGDLPGHGKNLKYGKVHDEDLTEYSEFIQKLMQNALLYQLPVFIMGHGLGATLAIRFLKKNDVECAGLILTSPWLVLKKTTNLLTNAMTSLGSLASNKKVSLNLDKKMLTRNNEGYQELVDNTPYHTNVTVGWYKEVQNLLKNIMAEQESHLSLPILLITAKQDKITDPSAGRKWLFKQKSTEIQFKEWPYSYHNVFHDNEREEIFIYCRDFMNNVMRSLGYII